MAEIGIKDQYFGMEDEMTGITREEAAKALGEYFGTRPIHVGGSYDKWTVADNEGKEWTLMSDASIKLERKSGDGYISTTNREYSVEMVTPKLTYDEIPELQEVIRTLKNAGAKVNKSCGLHIHIDAANHNRQSLKNLPLRYNNDKQKKPLFSRSLSVCCLLFNSFSKLKIDENYKEKRRLFY